MAGGSIDTTGTETNRQAGRSFINVKKKVSVCYYYYYSLAFYLCLGLLCLRYATVLFNLPAMSPRAMY